MSGMLRGVKFLSIAGIVLVIGYAGVVGYVLAKMDVEDVILCALHNESVRIPDFVCERYLFSFRGDNNDIEALKSGGGLSFVLGEETDGDKRFELARFFMSKGLSVDSPNMHGAHGFTALHTAVMFNERKTVSFLIDQNANLTLRDAEYKLTPLELAKHLQSLKAEPDRTAVISLLEKSS